MFEDEDGLLLEDEEHSAEEERFVLLGLSAASRVLIVCHCYRESDEIIRIISARRADRLERRDYKQRLER